MSISAKTIAELRSKTGAGIMDCKKALKETDGDMDKAIEYLQKKSLAAVGKRAGKIAAEGGIGSYVHGGRIGVIVEINCETDFVARGEQFQALLKDISMHIASMNPTYLNSDEISADEIAKQREIFGARLLEQGKPEAMIAKIVDGQLNKWFSEVCLLDQGFFKEDKKSVRDHVTEVAATIKENIQIRRFSRFELGEGIEREEADFAAEVAATAGL
jgi:elongation factor Ts